jgi:hypothetical protein
LDIESKRSESDRPAKCNDNRRFIFVTIFAISDLVRRHSNKSNGLGFPEQLARAKSRLIHWKSG